MSETDTGYPWPAVPAPSEALSFQDQLLETLGEICENLEAIAVALANLQDAQERMADALECRVDD